MSVSPLLEFKTQIVVRELSDGYQVAFPVADPRLISFGDDAASEQRLFLESYLLNQPPQTIARFAIPSAAELVEVDLLLERADLSRRLQLKTPITVACIVIPQKKSRWVVVPVIDHIFHLAASDDLKDVLAGEVRRMIDMRRLDALAFARLFPPEETRLVSLELTLDRSNQLQADRARALRKKLVESKRKVKALEVLQSVGLFLHQREELFAGPNSIGREDEKEIFRSLIEGKKRNAIILVGRQLVGKTSLLLDWLRSTIKGPSRKSILSTSAAQLIAGMSGLGQWQERVERVMKAAETLDTILYFDNLADLLDDRPGSHVDIPGVMRPYLEEGRVRLVGEIQPERLDRLQQRQAGFFATLQRVNLEPFSAQQSKEALEAHRRHIESQDSGRPNISEQGVDTLIDLVERYMPYQCHPGQAIRLYEELLAIHEKSLDAEKKKRIGEFEISAAFSIKSGVPLFLLRRDQPLEFSQVMASLRRRIIGQKSAVEQVARTVCIVKANLQPPEKPLATFLFVGPTGVGKTELARSLAAYLFGNERKMLRFDMSEYADGFAAQRLIWGTDRDEGILTRKVRQQPFGVLLLDEVEKAHPAVFDLLLQVCGEGRLTDVAGRTAYFSNMLIIMTSNLGAAHRKAAIGLRQAKEDLQGYYLQQVNKAFRPEFVNRIDSIVAFESLAPHEISEIAKLSIAKLSERRACAELGMKLDVSEDALHFLATGGYSETYGARQLNRHVEKELVIPLGRLLAKLGANARLSTLRVTALSEKPAKKVLGRTEDHELRLELLRAEKSLRVGRKQAPDIAKFRRAVQRYLQLETCEEVKERIDFIVAQLNRGGRKGKRKKQIKDIGALQTELHRLEQIWNRIEDRRGDLDALEELALTAIFEDEDPASFISESEALHARFMVDLYHLLVVQQPHRDQATLLVQELDGRRALDYWLKPLLASAPGRGWDVQVHIEGDRSHRGQEGKWPLSRRFGPARPADVIIKELDDRQRVGVGRFLLRVRGPFAGIAMALEAGVHRYGKAGSRERPMFFARLIAMRTTLTDEEWLAEALMPAVSGEYPTLRRQVPVRRFDGTSGPCLVTGTDIKVDLPLEEYWQRFEEIGVQQLLKFEMDEALWLDDLFLAALPAVPVKKPS
jgi:ATP-dependent Clp protease ATP-binding subunit ClpC